MEFDEVLEVVEDIPDVIAISSGLVALGVVILILGLWIASHCANT